MFDFQKKNLILSHLGLSKYHRLKSKRIHAL